jgi:alkanesulfonate monooxygenase SsuD/methylene tetrahydromethanopterin reductase-like flavin-dependent oxidoreductase (luciferase family)
VQQAKTVAQLAPGRFRLGIGPSHRDEMEGMYGFDFERPLANLREYLRVCKPLLQQGTVDFDGRYYHAHAAGRPMPEVAVMASALRPMAFRLCGAEADGAISWVCPGEYLRDVALPALRAGAAERGRPPPPLVAHAAVCVHEDASEVEKAARAELAYYPQSFFYQKMFTVAGYPDVEKTGAWSERALGAVLFSGGEDEVADRLHRLFEWGASELLVSIVEAGRDREASRERSLALLARVSREVRR